MGGGCTERMETLIMCVCISPTNKDLVTRGVNFSLFS